MVMYEAARCLGNLSDAKSRSITNTAVSSKTTLLSSTCAVVLWFYCCVSSTYWAWLYFTERCYYCVFSTSGFPLIEGSLVSFCFMAHHTASCYSCSVLFLFCFGKKKNAMCFGLICSSVNHAQLSEANSSIRCSARTEQSEFVSVVMTLKFLGIYSTLLLFLRVFFWLLWYTCGLFYCAWCTCLLHVYVAAFADGHEWSLTDPDCQPWSGAADHWQQPQHCHLGYHHSVEGTWSTCN